MQGVEEVETVGADGEVVLYYVPKIRCIDDFSESGVNGAAILREQISPEGLDGIARIARTWGSMVEGNEAVL
eukprot:2703674-Amphidinium_carterae.1